jgi:hypothetical protein
MDTAVLLGDITVLDRFQVRNAVLRIPEVSIRLREFQNNLDEWCSHGVDLFVAMQHDDITFSRMGNLRGAIVSVVQQGLYDRYRRFHKEPTLFIGSKGYLPVLRALAGNSKLSEVLQKLFVEDTKSLSMVVPQTRGAFDIIKVGADQQIQYLESAAQTMDELVSGLVEEQSIKRIVNIGPGSRVESYLIDPTFEHLTVEESIESDPWLGWFFAAVRSAS